MAPPPPAAPTRSGSPASRPSASIPHPTSATATATTTITPSPETPTSRYSVTSRASSSSSSGLDYYSHNSPPPPLSSQLYHHHHSTSFSGQDYVQSPAQVPVHRKPLPLPSQDRHASPLIDPTHLSSPLSIENKPPPIPHPATGPISPSSVEGGDSFISPPRNPNRYAMPLFYTPFRSYHPILYTSPNTAHEPT